MNAVPRYLQRTRQALGATRTPDAVGSGREIGERSEKTSRFEPGRRHRVHGPVIGIVHRTDAAFDRWRLEVGLPQAGIMTVEGEQVVVADVTAALRTGFIDVIGVRREEAP